MNSPAPSRRQVLTALTGLGIGNSAFARALAVPISQQQDVTLDMVQQAEWVAGLELSEQEREKALNDLRRFQNSINSQRSIPLTHDVAPAITFHPFPIQSARPARTGQATPRALPTLRRPQDEDDLAFLTVTELSALIHRRQVSSVELTELYLKRLERENETLNCLVTLTPELALKQARQADRELSRGHSRGPLHGIPWGAKDLIAVAGYPTTWGATPFQDQQLEQTATVARRLERAGAVLVGKLSLGALASGDKWFKGQTRNPWNPAEGSSGSSAGSAAATSAGLVGFAIGSETHGSIVSPCRRCAVTGLRPTFGRVPRSGCMTLSWSMDKLGPIARSVEDCGLIFAAIHGADGRDSSAVDQPFHWPDSRPLSQLRVGYFEGPRGTDAETLGVLRELGVRLVPITLPNEFNHYTLTAILYVEAATVFDELVKNGITEGLNRWPEQLRAAQFISAVDYLRANRLRTLLIEQMRPVFEQVDLYVGGNDLTLTNLTGHPTVVIPHGMIERRGHSVPGSLTFSGRPYGETELLAVADAFQRQVGDHLKRPQPPAPSATEPEDPQPPKKKHD